MNPEIQKPGKNSSSRLAEFFKSQKDIELAYLVVPTAEDNRSPLNDIYLGICFVNKLSKGDRIDELLRLTAILTELLKTERIDLMIMNDISSVINFEIIIPNLTHLQPM